MSTSAPLSYLVIATFPTQAMATEYIAWLNDGHIAAVIEGGATWGHAVKLDATDQRIRVMSQYEFPSRSAFDAYVRNVAPTLRAEGLAKFGPDRGVVYERIVGEVC